MKSDKILDKSHPLLRETSKEIPLDKIESVEIKSIIEEMIGAMLEQKDGIAIAAPQIGVPLRMFVVNGNLLKEADHTYRGDGGMLIFINPEIVKISKDKKEVEEGCLSVRWIYGKVRRATRVTLRAFDSTGKKIERGAQGLLAQIFQHEVDHLNGILFIDKAEEMWEMSEEEVTEMQTKSA